MSDDEEYEYDYGSDGGYGSDQNENNEEENNENDDLIEIENSFYGMFLTLGILFNMTTVLIGICLEGDDLKSDNPTKAIEMFEKVVELETNRGDQVKWFVHTFLYVYACVDCFFKEI